MQSIDIDINKLPSDIQLFVQSIIDTCNIHNVPISLTKTNIVKCPPENLECAGYFDDNPLHFATACKGHYTNWLSTFAHESCHLDQWLEHSDCWDINIPGYDIGPLIIFDKWITNQLEITEDTKNLIINFLVNLELDCERRTVDKIKKYNLPINLSKYTQMSNAYVWSYRLISETRNWEHGSVYSLSNVWGKMPNHFNNDYSILPDDIRNILIT